MIRSLPRPEPLETPTKNNTNSQIAAVEISGFNRRTFFHPVSKSSCSITIFIKVTAFTRVPKINPTTLPQVHIQ